MNAQEPLPGFIDSHFHVREIAKKGINVAEELDSALSLGMSCGMDIGVDLNDIDTRLAHTSGYRSVASTLGMSPHEAESGSIQEKCDDLETLLKKGGFAALGEIGLDWHWNYGTRERQMELFTSQLLIANELDLPVVIHNRLADADMVAILENNRPSRRGIMHCFSSGYEEAKRFIDMGFLISFAGNVTYKHANTIQDAAKRIPLSSIICETDSPYLSPHPVRGSINVPANVRYVYAYISELRGDRLVDVVSRIALNFNGLFC